MFLLTSYEDFNDLMFIALFHDIMFMYSICSCSHDTPTAINNSVLFFIPVLFTHIYPFPARSSTFLLSSSDYFQQ